MRKLAGSAVVAAVAAGVATAVVVGGTAAPSARASSLPAFNSCAALLDYAERHALRLVGPWGMDGAIGKKKVTYDFARLMRQEGEKDVSEVKCSEFGQAIIASM